MLCGYFSAPTTRTAPFINKQLCQPDLQFQPTDAPLVGQTKAIIISCWIIMNIFFIIKTKVRLSVEDMASGLLREIPEQPARHETDSSGIILHNHE